MKTDPCQSYQEMLVDYADSQLSTEQANEVASHVQMCPSCQQLVGALRRSLTISQGLWHTGYEQAKSVSRPAPIRLHTRFFHKLVAVAACVVMVGAAWMLIHRPATQVDPTVAQIN